MRQEERLKLIQKAINKHRLDMDEIKKNPDLNPDNADWIGGVEVIQKRKTYAEHESYRKFYNDIVNAMEMP